MLGWYDIGMGEKNKDLISFLLPLFFKKTKTKNNKHTDRKNDNETYAIARRFMQRVFGKCLLQTCTKFTIDRLESSATAAHFQISRILTVEQNNLIPSG